MYDWRRMTDHERRKLSKFDVRDGCPGILLLTSRSKARSNSSSRQVVTNTLKLSVNATNECRNVKLKY